MKKYILIILVISTLSACIKDVDVAELPDFERKLVATSFVEANNDTVALKLQWSNPLYKEGNYYDFENVENANVRILGNTEVQLNYNSNNQTYYFIGNQLDLSPNSNLKLFVEHAESGKSLQANSSIPHMPKFEIEYLNTSQSSDYEVVHRFRFKFLNQSDTSYFRIETFRKSPYGYKSQLQSSYILGKYNEEVILQIPDWVDYKNIEFTFAIFNCDKNYFNYHQSLSNYNEIPFFTEPTLIYSNIEGGLGVFGSYYVVEDSLSVNQ